MLRSYVAVALRHLVGQRLYSAINILGLAVGLACFILIALYVRHELGYDAGWANADRIYRISRDYYARDGARDRVPASANAPIAPALMRDFAEIERAARVFGGSLLLRRGDVAFYERRVRFADPELLEIFAFEWLEGDPATALQAPGSLVLTETLARKYFGTENALGATLTLNGRFDVAVTGIIRDLPPDTHLSIEGLAPLSTLVGAFGSRLIEQWNGNTDFHTYFMLREGGSIGSLEERLPAFLDRYVENGSAYSGLSVMPIADIHLRSQRDEEWEPPGSLGAVYGFGAIGIGILLIACVNFMNLSTARAATRAREVAVRKTVGAQRTQMIGQFLGESVLLTVIATLLAVALVELAMPAFAAAAGTALRLDYLGDPGLLGGLLVLVLAVGVLAGSYPAFYLSAFRPGAVLRGDVTRGTAGAALRGALVVFQFAIAIVLLIGTAVVVQQMRFARSVELGFDKERMVVLNAPAGSAFGSEWDALKTSLLEHPGVLGVTASHYTPFSFDDNQLRLRSYGSASFSRIQYMSIDYGFFETYGIELLAGRTFSPAFQSDRVAGPSAENPAGNAALVVNEATARLLGLDAEAAVGHAIQIGLDDDFSVRVDGRIVGVVRDTHFESIEMQVRPLVFLLYVGYANVDAGSIRVAPGDLPATLAHIDAVWRAFHPDRPIDRHFLDEDFDALYRTHDRQGRLFAAFSLLAIFVACLGLLGLASYTTEQRTKEIGIRKVVGGTVADIVRLFTGGFSKLVLAASLVAWPVAYLLMQRWLEGFAYRIDLSPAVFLGSALLAFAVALATVAAVAARAAAAKPIHSLRYE